MERSETLLDLLGEVLSPIIEKAVAKALLGHAQADGPEPLWDRRDLAQFLGYCETTTDRLAATPGFPKMKVRSGIRFDPAAVRTWLREHPGAA